MDSLFVGIPDVIAFNNKGELIRFRTLNTCNAETFRFIEALNDTTEYNTEDFNLDSLLLKFRNLDGSKLNEETIIQLKRNNFLVVVTWAKWTGKLNKTNVRVWEKQANNNKNTSITFIKLNMNLQEWWDKEKVNVTIKK